MRIITDSAADFTRLELLTYGIACVPMQVLFGMESFTAGKDLSDDAFWTRLHAGEIGTTSQPSPDAFVREFQRAIDDGEEAVYIGVSSALSGTLQSASIAASMLETPAIHLVDSLTVAGAQKLLVLHACRLRDEGKLTAAQIAGEIERLRSRVHLYASLDTLENLARSGRISKAAASIGTLAQLKPIVRITPETDGGIDVCGKAIGRHRAIDALSKAILRQRIDDAYPLIPVYSYSRENCCAMLKKLSALGVCAKEDFASALGPTLSTHVGAHAYGLAFVAAP